MPHQETWRSNINEAGCFSRAKHYNRNYGDGTAKRADIF